MANRFPQSPLKFAWQYIKKYKGTLFLILIITPIGVIVNALLPWFMSRGADLITSGKDPEYIWQTVFYYLPYMIALLAFSYTANTITMVVVDYKLSADLYVDVGKDLFATLLPHSKRFWQKNQAGTCYNKFNILRQNSSANGGYAGIIYFLYRRTLNLFVILFLIARINLSLAISIFIFASLLGVFLSLSSKSVEIASKEKSKKSSEAFAKMIDMCNNFFLIKAFGTKQKEAKTFAENLTQLQDATATYYQKHLKHTATQQVLSVLFQIIFVLYASYLWVQKEISVGDLIYIFTTLISMMMMFRIFGYAILGIKSYKGAMQSAIPLYNEKYEIKDGKKALKIKKGAIELKDVFFSYDGKKDVIQGISLKIKAKEKIGIVGVSGGGKTTIAHLLQRQYDIKSGTIKIDGQDIKDVKLNSLHKAIAFIPQDTTLFHRAISENAIYGSFNSSDKKQKDAFNNSYIDEFIKKLPKGYNTLVGDKGVKLSGGQRQRVGISRAILRDAPILILDEATSALDSKSEKYIQTSIQEIIKDKTVIAIAHRLSTLKEMDRIVVIEKGKIIQDGKPSDLIKKRGKFAKLWKIQMDI